MSKREGGGEGGQGGSEERGKLGRDYEQEGGGRERQRVGRKARMDLKQEGGEEGGRGETEDGFQARREGGRVRRRERGKPGWILSWRERDN